MPVEDGLHVAREIEDVGNARNRGDPVRRVLHRQTQRTTQWALAPFLTASHAAKRFPGLDGHETLHAAQTGQKFLFTVNDGQPIEQPAPYTIGIWQTTEAIPVTLKSGANTLHFELAAVSRGVTIKEFTLTPAK